MRAEGGAKWEPGERQVKSFRRELTEARSEVDIRVLRMVDQYQGDEPRDADGADQDAGDQEGAEGVLESAEVLWQPVVTAASPAVDDVNRRESSS